MEEQTRFNQRKETIRSIIYAEDYVPLKLKELAYLLNLSQKDRQDLKEVLDVLVAEGTVERTEAGRYVKPGPGTVTGVFSAHPRGFGFVTPEGEEEDIFIPEDGVNGAFHNDLVRVRLIREASRGGRRREGVVEAVIKRGTKTLVGTYEKSKSFGFVRPDDPRYGRDVFVEKDKDGGARTDDKVVVKLTSYGGGRKKPEGEITEILGSIRDPGTDVTSVIRAFGIEEAFSEAAAAEACRIPSDTATEALGDRKDFRSCLTITIDGEDARDLDDAVTLEKTREGFRLGVHIADVSHYVKEDSALDKAALERGTSVYLCDRVIPMLPRELSNGICSLNAGTDRLTLSCIMDLDAEGNVTEHTICESVIRVDKRMSYTGVNAILQGEPHQEADRDDIVRLCFLMKEAAGLLKERRKKRGAVDFDFPETKITVDAAGNPLDIRPYERNTATDIIEDFMLITNETVAEDYYWMDVPFLYRTHETPDPEKIRRLDTFIRNFGFYLKTGREHFHPKEIQKLLLSLEGEPEEALISRLALRAMKQARYTTVNTGHFGLSTRYYTHFTSPIRRYPDLQIHRIIKENLHGSLGPKRQDHYEEILTKVAKHSSERERRAQTAEREVEKLKKAEYMEAFIGKRFKGVISGVTARGFYVELPNTVEGMVPVGALIDDYYFFDEEQYRLIGEKRGCIFTLGQNVSIVVKSVNKALKTIDFVPEEFFKGKRRTGEDRIGKVRKHSFDRK